MSNDLFLAEPVVNGHFRTTEPKADSQVASAAQDDHAIFRAVVEGTAGSTGEKFFQDLVRHLASAIGVSFSAISEFGEVNTRVRTIAFWGRGEIQSNFEYDLPGTPCEEVLRGRLCHFPAGVAESFPQARLLSNSGAPR